MAAQLQNVWHLRRVAEASAKPCDICYKATTSVVITPDQKDHFYVCPGHLKDRAFCTPVVDEAEAAAKKRKEELDREVELIKKEYEEKLKMRKKSINSMKADKKADKKSEKSDSNEKNGEDDDADAVKEKDEKIKAATGKAPVAAADEGPRVFNLQKTFYQKRLDRIRNAEMAKRNKERLKSPNLFPSVPSGGLG